MRIHGVDAIEQTTSGSLYQEIGPIHSGKMLDYRLY